MSNVKVDGEYYFGNLDEKVNYGWSISRHSSPKLYQSNSYGYGIELMYKRGFKDYEGKFYFFNYYFIGYQTIGKNQAYLIGLIGAGDFKADKTFKGDGTILLSGGIYYGYGIGIVLSEDFAIELLYSHNSGKFNRLFDSLKYDMKYTRFNISFVLIGGSQTKKGQ